MEVCVILIKGDLIEYYKIKIVHFCVNCQTLNYVWFWIKIICLHVCQQFKHSYHSICTTILFNLNKPSNLTTIIIWLTRDFVFIYFVITGLVRIIVYYYVNFFVQQFKFKICVKRIDETYDCFNKYHRDFKTFNFVRNGNWYERSSILLDQMVLFILTKKEIVCTSAKSVKCFIPES